jgi:UDP-glucose 4-epimerase
MKERILVTGGLGMVGAFVCRALIASGRRPVVYDLGTSSARLKDIAAECDFVQGNVTDLPTLLGAVREHKAAAIMHFGGQVGPEVELNPWGSLNANLMGTTTVFECARLAGIERVIFPSSKMTYGPVAERHRHPHYEPVPEAHPREPLKLYGKIKRACEDVADHYAGRYGLDIIALRFGSAFAPGKFGRFGKVSPVMGLIEAAIAGRPMRIERGADQCDDLCYSGESANGAIAALGSPARPGSFRVYNIASGELISLARMIAILQELFPGWRGEAGPGLDYRDMGTEYYFLMSTQKAAAEIGFVPRFDFRKAALDYKETLARLAG